MDVIFEISNNLSKKFRTFRFGGHVTENLRQMHFAAYVV